MDPEVSQRLIQLNRQFYQTFAVQFSATRQRLQPGVHRIIESLPNPARILDLGCGNGEFARVLAERGQQGKYFGLDSSAELLQIAMPASPAADFEIHFSQADLSTPGWESAIAGQTFDVICAFAVLHHIPGVALRQQIMAQIAARLSPNGLFIHSEWQFLKSPRLRARIQDWQMVGLSETQVDADDYLLDWRGGGSGLRYVHHFSTAELKHLAEQTGFQIQTEFISDGEGNQLGFYQIWKVMQ